MILVREEKCIAGFETYIETLKHTFQTLKHIFQALKYKI